MDASVQCFPFGDSAVCAEVIRVRLCGERSRHPASVVVAAADRRSAGLRALARDARVRRGVRRARGRRRPADRRLDRVATMSTLRTATTSSRSASTAPSISDIAWERTERWRRELAGAWPFEAREISVTATRAQALLLAGWLRSRLGHDVAARARARGHPHVRLRRRQGDRGAAGRAAAAVGAALGPARALHARPDLRGGRARRRRVVAEPQIVAIGGGGDTLEQTWALFRHVLSLTGKERPRVLHVPTAMGDARRGDRLGLRASRRASATSRTCASSRTRPTICASSCSPRTRSTSAAATSRTCSRSGECTASATLLREAWENGVVLFGVSAGMICWFEAVVTDSFGLQLEGLRDGLGFLVGQRVPALRRRGAPPAALPRARRLGFPGRHRRRGRRRAALRRHGAARGRDVQARRDGVPRHARRRGAARRARARLASRRL